MLDVIGGERYRGGDAGREAVERLPGDALGPGRRLGRLADRGKEVGVDKREVEVPRCRQHGAGVRGKRGDCGRRTPVARRKNKSVNAGGVRPRHSAESLCEPVNPDADVRPRAVVPGTRLLGHGVTVVESGGEQAGIGLRTPMVAEQGGFRREGRVATLVVGCPVLEVAPPKVVEGPVVSGYQPKESVLRALMKHKHLCARHPSCSSEHLAEGFLVGLMGGAVPIVIEVARVAVDDHDDPLVDRDGRVRSLLPGFWNGHHTSASDQEDEAPYNRNTSLRYTQ